MEDISNDKGFRTDLTTFRKARSARDGRVFICVENISASTELWVDDDFEMIAVEVKGMNPKYTLEIIDFYRDENDDMFAIERLAARNLPTRNITKRSIISSDLNLTQLEWKSDAEKVSGFQTIVDNFVWDNGYTQVVSGLIRGDALLDIYLLCLDSPLLSCNILRGNSDHNGVLLEVECDEIWREPKVESIVPLSKKETVILGLQAFLRDEFNLWV